MALAETNTPSAEIEVLADGSKLKGYDANDGTGRLLYEVPIEGTIDLGLAPFVERVTEAAKANDVIFLRMNTFGGRVDAAVRIRDALLKAKAPTVVYVEGRAISAGALIALSCDTIIMNPGATIGDAMPIKMGSDGESQPTSEKAISYMRAEMAATAKAKGRRGDLAEAMVDPDIEIKGIVAKGKLLTLTADRAIELKIADALAPNFASAIATLNLTKAKHVKMQTHWAEKIARILTDPVISSLLMTFGVLGLLMELYTPGFGVGGIIGITCLVLFFFGQYTANLAGWEEAILIGVGVILMALEIFVIPGFGVTGILGITFTVVGMMMALVEIDLPLDVSFDLGYLQQAISYSAIRLAILMLVVVGATVVLGKYFPNTRLGKRFILSSASAVADGFVSQSRAESSLVGKRGVARGILRPAGIADIDGRRVDVVTEGDYIKSGTAIEVTQVDGNRIVVKQV